MLEEVVVPSKRNVFPELYRFVWFSNVNDVGKVLKVVNDVCSSHFRVKATVAHFDCNVVNKGEREREGEGVGDEGRSDVGRKWNKGEVVIGRGGKKNTGEGEKSEREGVGGGRPSCGKETGDGGVDEGG